MRKNLLLTVTILFVFCLGSMAQAEVDIDRTDAVINIDGEIEGVWYETSSQPIDIVKVESDAAGVSEENFSALWMSLWDDEYWYILVDVKDDELINDDIDDITHQDDGFDMPIDPGNTDETAGMMLFTINWSDDGVPAISTEKGCCSFEEGAYLGDPADIMAACTTTDEGWILEMAIPWGDLTEDAIEAGYELGFDVRYNDDDGNVEGDGNTEREAHYVWSTEGGWNTPADWGTVRLGSNVASTPTSVSQLANAFKIYPTQVKSKLNIGNYQGEVTIFNVSGAQLMYIDHAINTIDVSALNKGLYFVHTNEGVGRFMKM